MGAEALLFPTIRIADPSDPTPFVDVVRRVESFDWIIFTSANGVERFWAKLREQGTYAARLKGVALCAIGRATAAAIESQGGRADLIPDEYVAESLVDALVKKADLAGCRVLLPRAEVARSVLPDALRDRGAEVTEVAAYRTVPDGREADEMRARIRAGTVDVVTFTSSSTVENYVEILGTDLGGGRVASIGPITSATARELGLRVDIEAAVYTVDGLITAIVEQLER
jgi:uroporphyrinogen III methyltransferase/synthase